MSTAQFLPEKITGFLWEIASVFHCFPEKRTDTQSRQPAVVEADHKIVFYLEDKNVGFDVLRGLVTELPPRPRLQCRDDVSLGYPVVPFNIWEYTLTAMMFSPPVFTSPAGT